MPSTDRPGSQAHHTFLLSLWQEGRGRPWRAVLRPAYGGPRLGFGDLEQLAAFLLRLQDELTVAGAAPVGLPRKGGEVEDQHASPSIPDDPSTARGQQR